MTSNGGANSSGAERAPSPFDHISNTAMGSTVPNAFFGSAAAGSSNPFAAPTAFNPTQVQPSAGFGRPSLAQNGLAALSNTTQPAFAGFGPGAGAMPSGNPNGISQDSRLTNGLTQQSLLTGARPSNQGSAFATARQPTDTKHFGPSDGKASSSSGFFGAASPMANLGQASGTSTLPQPTMSFGQSSGQQASVFNPPAENPFKTASPRIEASDASSKLPSLASGGTAAALLGNVGGAPKTSFATLFPQASLTSVEPAPSQVPPTSVANAFGNPQEVGNTPAAMDGPFKMAFGKPTLPLARASLEPSSSVNSGFGRHPAPSVMQHPTKNQAARPELREGKRDLESRVPKLPDGPQSTYAKAILDQLRQDGISPPKWPAGPESSSNRVAMENFREVYKKHRDRVRASLMKANLIDNPEISKRLEDAIDFKGICEDMCPEFEKITRIIQYDVKMEEKKALPDGTTAVSTPLMVKALARSAAGQEAPLPMDVRSVPALRRTLDYLIDVVLATDANLPSTHNFLWDRTRAIRRDFVFHSKLSDEEMLDQIYCLETITRFHVTALHLLSQKGFAAEDFSEQQEREQLGKTLLSLTQAYDDCHARSITCENEAEFRAYFIMNNVHHTSLEQKMLEWNSTIWFSSNEVQTAMSLAQALKSTSDWEGPLKPAMPATAAASSFTTFFRIVEDPKVSYTMACFAEIHFRQVRRGLLVNLTKAYARARDAPRDITVQVLNQMLRFDTDDDAVEFAEAHGFAVASDGGKERFVVLDKQAHVKNPTLRQSFSQQLVERKRGSRPLPDAIHSTILQEAEVKAAHQDENNEDSLFVSQDQWPNNEASGSAIAEVAPFALSNITGVKSSEPGTIPRSNATPSSGMAVAAQSAPTEPTKTVATQSPAPAPSAKRKSDGDSENPSDFFSLNKKPRSANPPAIPSPLQDQGSRTASALPSPDQPSTSVKGLTPGFIAPPPLQPPPSLPTKEVTGSNNVGPITSKAPLTAQASLAPTTRTFLKPAAPGGKSLSKPRPAVDSRSPTPAKKQAVEKDASSGDCLTNLSPARQPDQARGHPAAAQPDPMDGFAKWFVFGDRGLFEEFQTGYVAHLLREVWDKYALEVDERKRQEDDEKSWITAKETRTFILGKKYFGRWRETARNQRLNRRARKGREELKAYMAAKARAEREAKKKAVEQAEARQKASMESSFVEELRASRSMRASLRQSHGSSMEATLLATGVFSGVRDERNVATRVVRDASPTADARSTASTPVSKASKTPQGSFQALKGTVKDAVTGTISRVKDMIVGGRVTKSGTNGRTGSRARNSGSPPPAGATPLRKSMSGRTTATDPDRLLPRKRKATNFDEFRRSISTDGSASTPKHRSNIRLGHWRLRAMGMVHMPNGQYLHESLAIPMYEGRRFPGIGRYGLPPLANETSAENSDAPANGEDQEPSGSPAETRHTPPAYKSPSNKRKRSLDDDEGDEIDVASDAPSGGTAKSSTDARKPKKTKPWDREETDRLIREMREAAAAMDEGKEWFKEQAELLQKDGSEWDRA